VYGNLKEQNKNEGDYKMKSTLLVFLGALVLLASSAMAAEVTCQSVLSSGDGNFGQLEAAGSCDVGNVTFSGFNTTFIAADVLVSANGFSGTAFGQILGFTYSYLNGVFPGGSVGLTAVFDPLAATDGAGGVACGPGAICGIDGVETQLNSILGNGAVVTTAYSGGYVGSSVVNSTSLAAETYQATIPMIVAPINLVKAASYNGMGSINTFSTEVIAGETPEPGTLGLAGVALLGLGLLRRRKVARQ
jgi:hypothetical protein